MNSQISDFWCYFGESKWKKVYFNTVHGLGAKLSERSLESNTDDFFGDM